jgi:hypothetical protein
MRTQTALANKVAPKKATTTSHRPDKPQGPPDKRYLTAPQLRTRYGGVSHMWIVRRLELDPLFPRPYLFGRFRFFALDEIEAWERTCARAGAA